jgi:hypothetical protein
MNVPHYFHLLLFLINFGEVTLSEIATVHQSSPAANTSSLQAVRALLNTKQVDITREDENGESPHVVTQRNGSGDVMALFHAYDKPPCIGLDSLGTLLFDRSSETRSQILDLEAIKFSKTRAEMMSAHRRARPSSAASENWRRALRYRSVHLSGEIPGSIIG